MTQISTQKLVTKHLGYFFTFANDFWVEIILEVLKFIRYKTAFDENLNARRRDLKYSTNVIIGMFLIGCCTESEMPSSTPCHCCNFTELYHR